MARVMARVMQRIRNTEYGVLYMRFGCGIPNCNRNHNPDPDPDPDPNPDPESAGPPLKGPLHSQVPALGCRGPAISVRVTARIDSA